MRWTTTRVRVWGLVGILFLAPLPTLAEDWIGWDLACDSERIELADPAWKWALLEGFEPVEGDGGGGVVVDSRGSLLLLLGSAPRDRTLHLEARTDDRKVGLSAWLNGHPLGRRDARRRINSLSWSLPPEATRRGLNLLVLERSRARTDRPSRLILERLELRPRRCGARRLEALAVAADRPMTLGPRSLVLLPAPAAGEALLELSFRGKPAGTTVSASCYSPLGVHPLAELDGGGSLRGHGFFPLDQDCAKARGVALMGLGPGPADGVTARLRAARWPSWRSRIGLGSAVLVLLLLAAIVGAAAASRRFPATWAPWGDAGWIFMVALLLRIGFYFLYPRSGESGDAHEYLLRASLLASGEAAFWSDTSWHSWATYLRPPGYYAFLALLTGPLGGGRTLIILTQLSASATAASATYLLAYPLFNRTAAWAAGLLFSLYLGSIATYSRILTEPLFMLFAVPGLAALAWLTKRPGWMLATAAGILFGLAALVRAGPVYYLPLAGLLLVPALGLRKGLRYAVIMVGAMTLTVLPWCVRNSIVVGAPMGIEDVSVANLLLNHPDDRLIPVADLDLDEPADERIYQKRLKLANGDGRLRGHRTAILGRILLSAARDPGRYGSAFAANLRDLLGPLPDAYLQWILIESDAVRVARLTSLVNVQFAWIGGLAAVGLFVSRRRPAVWPIFLWFALNTALVALLFHSIARFRFQTTPVLMVLAGAAIAAGIERTRSRARAPLRARPSPNR